MAGETLTGGATGGAPRRGSAGRSRLLGQQRWVLSSEQQLPVKHDAIDLAEQHRPN